MKRDSASHQFLRASRAVTRRVCAYAVLALLLALCLFLDTTPVRLSRFWGPIAAELLATFRDPGTQWMVYACCAIYFVTFTLLGKGRLQIADCRIGGRHDRPRCETPLNYQPSTLSFVVSPDLWLCIFALWVTVPYAFDYDTASRNTHALALMAGMAIAQGVRLWGAKGEYRTFNIEHRTSNKSKQGGAKTGDRQQATEDVGVEAGGEHRTFNIQHSTPKEGAGSIAECRVQNADSGIQNPGDWKQNLKPSDSESAGGAGESRADRQSNIVDRKSDEPSTFNSQPSTIFSLCLLLLLAAAALWQPEAGTVFQYRGQPRWQGPWDNPNTFGLLMGTGVVLAAGWLLRSWRMENRRSKMAGQGLGEGGEHSTFNVQRSTSKVAQPSRLQPRDACATLWHWLRVLLLLAAAGLCGYGLLRSYSRGAWLGTGLGLAVLAYPMWRTVGTRFTVSHSFACGSWLFRNRFPLFILFLSLFTLSYWELRHTEQPLVRRVFTVGNPNDFSWRNRVAAWEGALAMMAENPLTGVGWSRPEAIYDRFYKPVKVDEGMAIQLNHYLMVGMSAGVPALLFFVGYLGTVLTRSAERGTRNQTVQSALPQPRGRECRVQNSGERCHSDFDLRTSDFRRVCAAGALVLLVGLWFDGGLFNLATAAPLWLLLGLARVAQTSGLCVSASSSLTTEGNTDRRSVPRGARHQQVGMRSTASPNSEPLGNSARTRTKDEDDFPGLVRPKHGLMWAAAGVAVVLLLTALLWAHARDPFRRVTLTLKPDGAPATEARVVMPKSGGPFPVALYVHGSGADVLRDGDELQQMATLGLAAVAFDYDKTNAAHFNAQMLTLLDAIAKQRWARAESSGWIANSLGAQRTLSFVVEHPERAPQVMVRLNGGNVEGRVQNAEFRIQETGDRSQDVEDGSRGPRGEQSTFNAERSTSRNTLESEEHRTLNIEHRTSNIELGPVRLGSGWSC